MLFQRHFGHVKVQILKFMNTEREIKMPAIFPLPHLNIGKIALFWESPAGKNPFLYLTTPFDLLFSKPRFDQLVLIQWDTG